MPRRLAPPTPPLRDDAILLEPLGREHGDHLDALTADEDTRRFTYVPFERPPAGFGTRWAERYEEGWQDASRAGFAIRDAADQTFLGFASFVKLDLDAAEGEIGYVVVPEARGRGIAARALGLLTDWGFDGLALERIELRIETGNPGSERVAARAGYTREGVLRNVHFKEGRRVDLGVWSRLRADAA